MHGFGVPPNVLRHGDYPENWRMSAADVEECYAVLVSEKPPPAESEDDAAAKEAAADAAREEGTPKL